MMKIIIDNTELNLERAYRALPMDKEQMDHQIKKIQSLSYSQLIKDIQMPSIYPIQLIDWELQRRKQNQFLSAENVDQLNHQLKTLGTKTNPIVVEEDDTWMNWTGN